MLQWPLGFASSRRPITRMNQSDCRIRHFLWPGNGMRTMKSHIYCFDRRRQRQLFATSDLTWTQRHAGRHGLLVSYMDTPWTLSPSAAPIAGATREKPANARVMAYHGLTYSHVCSAVEFSPALFAALHPQFQRNLKHDCKCFSQRESAGVCHANKFEVFEKFGFSSRMGSRLAVALGHS